MHEAHLVAHVVGPHSEPLAEALAHALRKAADAGQWALVSELATTIARMGHAGSEDAPDNGEAPAVVVSLRDRIK